MIRELTRVHPTGCCRAQSADGDVPLIVIEFMTDEGAWIVGIDDEEAGKLMTRLQLLLKPRGQ